MTTFIMTTADEILNSIVSTRLKNEVTNGNFPYPGNNISMHPNEREQFLEALDKE